MIDVAHDGDHGSASHAILIDLRLLDFVRGFFFVTELVGGRSEVARQLLGQLHVQGLIDGGENLLIEEALHHDVALDAEFFGKLFDGDAFGDGDLAVDRRRLKGLLLARNLADTTLFRIRVAAAVAGSRLDRMAAPGVGGQRGGFGAQRSGEVGCIGRPRPRRPPGPPASGIPPGPWPGARIIG